MEVVGTSTEQADRTGKAGQRDNGRQNELTRLTKQTLDVSIDDGAAIADIARHPFSAVAQMKERDIDSRQPDRRDQPRDGQIFELAAIILNPLLAQQTDDQGTEHQGGQSIHGVVPLQHPLGQGCFYVLTAGIGHGTLRRHKDPDRQNEQHRHQGRRQVLADRIEQLAAIERHQDHQRKEAQGIEQQPPMTGIAEPRLEPHLVGNQTGAGNGKCRPHDDVDGDGQRSGDPCRQVAGQLGPATGTTPGATLGHRNQGDQRQPHRRQQKTAHGGDQMLTGHKTGQRRKNDIACPQIEGERHKPQSEYVGQLQ